MQPISVDELARECWGAVSEAASSRHLAVSWRFTGGAALGDPEGSRIVVTNLFANVVSYADEGGQVTIESTSADRAYELTVANTGSTLGVEHELLVLERFWRADHARARGGAHCGLGLSLCREIVERHGGTIRVRCERSGWFRVTIVLPTARRE